MFLFYSTIIGENMDAGQKIATFFIFSVSPETCIKMFNKILIDNISSNKPVHDLT